MVACPTFLLICGRVPIFPQQRLPTKRRAHFGMPFEGPIGSTAAPVDLPCPCEAPTIHSPVHQSRLITARRPLIRGSVRTRRPGPSLTSPGGRHSRRGPRGQGSPCCRCTCGWGPRGRRGRPGVVEGRWVSKKIESVLRRTQATKPDTAAAAPFPPHRLRTTIKYTPCWHTTWPWRTCSPPPCRSPCGPPRHPPRGRRA